MRVKPVFKLTLVASALALPLPAYSLALGRLTVSSALGQPLVAQIELSAATREELDSLQAKIADPSLYRQNNLAYQGVLSRARVTVERTPEGRAILRVTSPTPVNEPYLDLMVDVSWASGRVVREYTFLLDPPGTGTMMAVDPVAPARVGAATTAAAPPPTAPVARTAPPAAEAATPPADGYVVRRGDTLSTVAARYKPDNVSLEQMLVALFNANASAFEGNNMNRLRSGAILTIPTPDAAQTTQASEATRVVRVQASDWRSYRDRVAGAAPSVDGAATREAGGQITAAAVDRAGAAPAGRDQVRVSREASPGRVGIAEDAVVRNKQLADANARIAELERTVKDMQRALELRSPTLAQAQQQADAAKGKAASASPPAVVAPIPAPPATVAPSPAPSPKPATPTVAPAPTTIAAAPTPPPPVKPEPPKAAEPVKAAEPIKAAPEPPKAVEPVKAPEPAPVAPIVTTPATSTPAPAPAPAAKAPASVPAKALPKSTPPPEPSFFDELMANTPTWAIGAGALAILGGIAALVAARRRKTTKFEDSIISGTDIKTNTVFGSTGGGVVNTGENSLASDFSREGLGNIDTDEVDPIAEAEVYLAYGRDAQAEEILKDALKKDPQRQEIYLKLLEIHAQHNKPSAFETMASELYSVSQGQGEVWQKAVALGRQLDPNNPMFADGAVPPPRGMTGAAAAAAAAGAVAASDAVDAAPLYAPDITPVKVPGKNDPLDFSLEDEISIAPTSGATQPAPFDGPTTIQRAGEALDFGSDRRAAVAGTAASLATAKAVQPPSAMEQKVETVRREVAEKFDLDFQLDDNDKTAPLPRRETMPVGHGVAESGPLGGSSLTRPVAAIELDKLDLGFDPDRATFEDPTPSVLDGQWHDAATKLDLAKAYQEMGDVEGAREILQEVLHEGDDQQKSEAQALLAKLA